MPKSSWLRSDNDVYLKFLFRGRSISTDLSAAACVRVLLVEDHNDTLIMLARLLRSDGHIVHVADGYQAALLVAQREEFDVAVCDISLWDGNGCDLLRDLQKHKPVKAIAMTGYTLEDEVENYIEAGFGAVLGKPLDHKQLSATIASLAAR